MSFHALDAAVLSALRAGDVLTPAIAAQRWRMLALHSAISRLREQGHVITCTMRSENGRRFGSYKLITGDKGGSQAPFPAAPMSGRVVHDACGSTQTLDTPPDTPVYDRNGKLLCYATGYGPGYPP